MADPGQQDRCEHRNYQVTFKALHERSKHLGGFHVAEAGAEQAQGQEHQPQSDQRAADAFKA